MDRSILNALDHDVRVFNTKSRTFFSLQVGLWRVISHVAGQICRDYCKNLLWAEQERVLQRLSFDSVPCVVFGFV